MSELPVVVCVDLTANPAAVPGAPCPDGQGLATVQAVLVSPTESPFDVVEASGYFTFAFSVVVLFWLAGYVVSAVRKPIRQGGS